MISLPENEDFHRGVRLFNQAHFFDAHEVLEDVWRALPRNHLACRHLRLHVQGMVQLAVAFHHLSTGNYLGARSVLERALGNLKDAEHSFPDLDLGQLRADLTAWREYLDERSGTVKGRNVCRGSVPTLPQIMLLCSSS
jgi:predicted metal-dependent hydrolase